MLLSPSSSPYASVQTLPSGTIWNSFTYGNGHYVAVGDNGLLGGPNLCYSADGINWTPGKNLPQGPWTAVEYGNGIFVAGSDNFMGDLGNGMDFANNNWVYFFSANDPTQDWIPCNRLTPPPQPLYNNAGYQTNQISYGNGVFRTIGILGVNSGTLSGSLLSSDGLNWVFDTNLNFPCQYSAIARGIDRFVIVAVYGPTSYPAAAVLIDGQSSWTLSDWTLSDIPNTFNQVNGELYHVIYDKIKGVFRTESGHTSSDGITWTLTTDKCGSLAVNEIGQIAKIKDGQIGNFKVFGIYYTDINTGADKLAIYNNIDTTLSFDQICYINGIFIASSGFAQYSSAYSYDGITWNPNDVYVPPPNQPCIFEWVDIGGCVNGMQNQQLNITQSSYGNGRVCPGNQNSGQVIACDTRVPVNTPPPPPPPTVPIVSPPTVPVASPPNCVAGIQGNVSAYISGPLTNDVVTDGPLTTTGNLGAAGKVIGVGGNVIYIEPVQNVIRMINPIAVKTIVGFVGHEVDVTNGHGYIYTGLPSRSPVIQPIGMTLDMNGILYFVTQLGDVISVINDELNFITNLPGATAISIAPMACDSSNDIYISINKTIYNISQGTNMEINGLSSSSSIIDMEFTACDQLLITNGLYLYTVNMKKGNADILIRPKKVGSFALTAFTVDSLGNIYFMDSGMVNMMDNNGNLSTVAKLKISPNNIIQSMSYTTNNSKPIIYLSDGSETILQLS